MVSLSCESAAPLLKEKIVNVEKTLSGDLGEGGAKDQECAWRRKRLCTGMIVAFTQIWLLFQILIQI